MHPCWCRSCCLVDTWMSTRTQPLSRRRTSGVRGSGECSRNPVRLLVKKSSKIVHLGDAPPLRRLYAAVATRGSKEHCLREGEEMGSKSLAVSRHRRYAHAVTQRDSREIGSVPPRSSIRCASRNDKRSKGLAGADPFAETLRGSGGWCAYRLGRGNSRDTETTVEGAQGLRGDRGGTPPVHFPARSRPCPSRDPWSTCT